LTRFRWLVQQARRRSIWRVLAVYAAGAWIVLQVVHTLAASLGLPEWFAPLAFVLLLVGLPVVVATAFIQDDGPTDGRAEGAPPGAASTTTETLPAPPADATARRASGSGVRRFLTWRYAVGGGILAFALWGVGAAGWLVLDGRVGDQPAAATESRIVVLPFENLGGSEDQHFAEGMTEEITARLARVGGLGVIARTSALQYRETRKSVAEIGAELGVNYLLGGTVRWEHRDGGPSRVRVTPQLIRVADATNLWSDVYDEPLAGVFQVQSDIAQRVVDALGITLLDRELRSVREAPTTNVEAYGHFLQANAVLADGYTEDRTVRAIDLYTEAVRVDPAFAAAWGGLSRAHAALYWYHWDRSDQRLARARAAADRAVQIAPGRADAHAALGWYHYWGHLDYDRALDHFRRALELEPNSADGLQGVAAVRRRQGRFDEAAAAYEQAQRLDPRAGNIAYQLGQSYHFLRRYEEAARHYEQAHRLSPDFGRTYAFSALLEIDRAGDTRAARRYIEEAASRTAAQEEPFLIATRVLTDLIDGRYAQALAYLDSVPASAVEEQFYFVPKVQLQAQVHDLAGRRDLARAYYDSARIATDARIRDRPFEDARLHSARGIALAGLGRGEEAIAAGRLGVALMPMVLEAWRGAYRVEDLARIYTMVGELDLAVDQLEILLERPTLVSANRLRLDPTWTPLRGHPRFDRLVRQR
jgi:TolB-like protein/tetratricopeptide (TPR) repeat protein